jgi:hypothetical protein
MIKGEKVFDEVFSARNFNTSPLTISDLDGDFYNYEMVAFFANVSGDSIVDITLNSDTASNYRNYEMKGLSSTANAAVGDSDTAIELQNLIGTANPNLLKMNITGSSGDERYIDCFYSADGAILKQSSYWKNTADVVDEITLTAASSVTSDAHIMLYRTPKASGQSSWELMETLSWSAETATKSFTGLLGDSDKEYRILWDSDQTGTLEINGDGGTNYTRHRLRNNAGTIEANYSTGVTFAGLTTQSVMTIYAQTGVKRVILTSGGQITARQQTEYSQIYTNTATEITSLDLAPTSSANATAKLYRKRNPDATGDTLPFEVIETVDISGSLTAGHTFSGLLGDSVNLYKIEFVGETDADLRLRINGDTGSNYIDQYLYANSASVSAATITTSYSMLMNDSNGESSSMSAYIYPKSGEDRAILSRSAYRLVRMKYNGFWWSNSVDEITSLKVYANVSSTITGKLILSRLK